MIYDVQSQKTIIHFVVEDYCFRVEFLMLLTLILWTLWFYVFTYILKFCFYFLMLSSFYIRSMFTYFIVLLYT